MRIDECLIMCGANLCVYIVYMVDLMQCWIPFQDGNSVISVHFARKRENCCLCLFHNCGLVMTACVIMCANKPYWKELCIILHMWLHNGRWCILRNNWLVGFHCVFRELPLPFVLETISLMAKVHVGGWTQNPQVGDWTVGGVTQCSA